MEDVDNTQVTDSRFGKIAQIARIDSLRHKAGTIELQIAEIYALARSGLVSPQFLRTMKIV